TPPGARRASCRPGRRVGGMPEEVHRLAGAQARRRQDRAGGRTASPTLTIATCAVIAGAESWEAIAECGRTKEAFFRSSLRLENSIPSPDTFERVFAKLAPGAFGRWMAAACEATGLVPIAIDGKSARAAKR